MARLAITFAMATMAVTFTIAAFRSTAVLAETAPVIRDIKVTGNSRIEVETIKSHLSLAVGQRYEAAKADESIKALFATGLFRDVHIALEGATLAVSVAENPMINRVAFEGNKVINTDTLSRGIQLEAHSLYTRARVQTAVQSILDEFRRQGFYATQVDPKVIELDHNRVDLVFEIREGPNTKVVGINFTGNRSFTDSELRSVITTTESNLLDFLKSTSIYDPDHLNADRELLRRHYLKKRLRRYARGLGLRRYRSGREGHLPHLHYR